jgi:hypothetical protein
LKNLGRVRSTPDEFAAKIVRSWERNYWRETKIRRMRDPSKTGPAFAEGLKELLADPDSGREVHLVVNMLSLASFDAIDRVNPPPHFLQVNWLLSAFLNSCREAGAKAVIVCSP